MQDGGHTAILNKMQDGCHIGVGANLNIVFLIAYVISFPKMYSFHTLQKILTKLHSELDYSLSVAPHHRLSLTQYPAAPPLSASSDSCCRFHLSPICCFTPPVSHSVTPAPPGDSYSSSGPRAAGWTALT